MRTTNYPSNLRLRVPRELPDALRLAAGRRNTSPSEFARQAILGAIEQAGVRLL